MINYISGMSSCCLCRMVYSDRIVNARYQRRPAVTIDCIKHVARNCNEKKNWIIMAGGQGDWKTGLKKTRHDRFYGIILDHVCQPTETDINLNYALRSHLSVPSRFCATIDGTESREKERIAVQAASANNRIYIKSATWSALCLPLDLSIDFLPLVTLAPFIDSLQCYPSP